MNIDAVIAFFRDPATWRIAEKNDFKETALRLIESALETVAGGEEFRFEELRATVSAVAVRSNGEFLAISIGDGTVVALDRDLNPSVLIAPYREGSRNRTVYTNDLDGARAHMAAWGGTLTQSEFEAFAVFTDGADHLTRSMVEGANILRTAAACTLFGSGDEYITEAISEIAEEHSRDDVALAVLTNENDEVYAVAKSVLLEARAAKEAAEAEAAQTEAAQEILSEPIATAYENEGLEDFDALDEAEDIDAAGDVGAAETVATEEEEELPNPPMPAQEDAAPAEPVTPPAPADEEIIETEPQPCELIVLRAIYAEARSAQALIHDGYLRKNRVLDTMLPLLRAGKVRYEDGKFVPGD